MIRALAYLQLHTWKNHLLVRLRRLRQPKYLFGAMAGLLYFYLYFFRYLFQGGRRGDMPAFFTGEQAYGFQMLGATLLMVAVLMSWVLPKKRAALNFNEAEVAFLFTAPISRRTLIHYKLITGQVGILLTSLFLTLISGRFASSSHFWIPFLAYWMLFATLGLHFLAASFMRTMLLDRGLSPKRWRIVAVMIAAVIVGAIGLSVMQAIDAFDPNALENFGSFTESISTVFSSGITPYILFPFQLLLQPLFAPDPMSFLLAALPVLLLFSLQYTWVLRMNVSFEEASAEHSRKRAEILSSARKGDWKLVAPKARRAWFSLSPVGLPFVAIFWKNLISMGNAFRGRTLVFIGVFLLIPTIVIANVSRGQGGTIVGFIAMVFLIWSVMLGPALVRSDFRQDFPNTDLLKTFPLSGWQIALGQLLAPTLVLAMVQWFMILVALLFLDFRVWNNIPLLTRFSMVAGLSLTLPILTMLTMTIPNLAVMLFPAWFQIGRDTPQGIEATGQRIILMIGQLLALTILILPLVIISGVASALAFYVGGLLLAVIAASLVGTLVLAAEVGLMVWLLGKAFLKLDLSRETST